MKRIKLGFIVCPNGFGHLKRTLSIIDSLLNTNARISCRLYLPYSHQKALSYWKNNCINNKRLSIEPTKLEETEYFNQKSYKNFNFISYKSCWKNLAAKINKENFDLVISDNMLGILGENNDAIILGSFLWHKISNGIYSEEITKTCNYEQSLFNDIQPRIISLENFTPKYISSNPNNFTVSMFCKKRKLIKHINSINSILVTGGGSGANNTFLISIVKELNKKNVHLLVDKKIKSVEKELSNDPLNEFTFARKDFEKVDLIICRPGIGIITEAVEYNIPLIGIDDQKNDEISFNATQIEKIGIGRKMKKTDSLSLLLEEIQNNYSNYINTLDAINKEGSTATARLLMDMV